jgi:hydroxymethylbilane synthase
MARKTIKIGTRGSQLALWQAEFVAQQLKRGGVDTETLIIETKGDKILDVTIGKVGGKGVFTEEIEEQLLLGTIDIAVHSAKDMPSELPENLELIAFTEREKVNDVLVSDNREVSILTGGKDWLIGTSSTRRAALLKHHFPHIKTIAVRGNLQTRIRKMREGQCDALLLAFAGINRLGYNELIVEEMPLNVFTTPAGQGSIAIEVSNSLVEDKRKLIYDLVNHRETEVCVRGERAFMKTLHGGCSIPVFVHAQLENDSVHLEGGIVSLDGKRLIKDKVVGSVEDVIELGEKLGKTVLDRGGKEILDQIKEVG